MNPLRKVSLLVLAVAVVVVGFVVIKSSDKNEKKAGKQSVETVAKERSGEKKGGAPEPIAKKADIPVLVTGSVKEIKVHKGEQVTFIAKSSDPEEIHVHGYDILRQVPVDGQVKVAFKADKTGVFEIEFHGVKEHVGKLTVEP